MDYQGFGNGSDGVATLSGTDAPVDSSCSGTAGLVALTATNAAFAQGKLVLIHQSRGTGAGNWEFNVIGSYVAGTITTAFPLVNTYADSGASQAQVIQIPEYSSVTVSGTLTAKAWDGDVGGIIIFFCNGDVIISGTITANGKGFRGATSWSSGNSVVQYAGEGTAGAETQSMSANGNGGGGGRNEAGAGRNDIVAGAGGSNGTVGTEGSVPWTWDQGHNSPGSVEGTSDLTTMVFGGGGGTGAADYNNNPTFGGDGANGGGIIIIFGATITCTGSGKITSNGDNPPGASSEGGAGAGGSILLKGQVIDIGTLCTAIGGTTDQLYDSDPLYHWGLGGDGRIRIEACSLTGTTDPSASQSVGGNSWCQVPGSIF